MPLLSNALSLLGALALIWGLWLFRQAPAPGFYLALSALLLLLLGAKWRRPQALAHRPLFRATVWVWCVAAATAIEGGRNMNAGSDIMGASKIPGFFTAVLLVFSLFWAFSLMYYFEQSSRRERTVHVGLIVANLAFVALIWALFMRAIPAGI